MDTSEDRTEIAMTEADDTFKSISDLDSICDTTLIAATFLLAAIATWTAFAYGRLHQTPVLQVLYGVLVAATVGVTCLSVNQLIRSLMPRAFHGEAVGRVFSPGQLFQTSSGNPDIRLPWYEAITNEEENDALEERLDEWLAEYVPGGIDTGSEFFLARLFNYKHVARLKVYHTARALAWFRVAVGFFILIVVLSLVGPYLVA